MHSAGFVDILEYYASAALCTPLCSHIGYVKKSSNQRIFHCLVYGSPMDQKLSTKRRGLRAEILNKHEANSLPVDIEVVHICTFTQFFKVLQCRHNYLTITKLRKRSQSCSCSPSSPPFCLVLCSLLTLMVSK